MPVCESMFVCLFVSVFTCPVPTWPQYTTLAPMQVSSSCAAWYSSSNPPTMKVNLARLAAPTPKHRPHVQTFKYGHKPATICRCIKDVSI